jgi:hypothetical protein
LDVHQQPLSDIQDITLTARDRELIEGGDWSEVRSVGSDNSPGHSPLHTRLAREAQMKERIYESKLTEEKIGLNIESNTNPGRVGKGSRGPRAGRRIAEPKHRASNSNEDGEIVNGNYSEPQEKMRTAGIGLGIAGNHFQLPAVNSGGIMPGPQNGVDDDAKDVQLKPRMMPGGYAQRKNIPRVALSNAPVGGPGFSNSPRAIGASGLNNPREKLLKASKISDIDTFEALKSNGKWLGGQNQNPSLDDLSPRGTSIDLQNNLQKAKQRQQARERERLRMQLADHDGDESVTTIQSDNSEYSDARRGGHSHSNHRKIHEKVIGPGLGQLLGPDISSRNRSLPVLQKGGR